MMIGCRDGVDIVVSVLPADGGEERHFVIVKGAGDRWTEDACGGNGRDGCGG